jgi:hypothetical protein
VALALRRLPSEVEREAAEHPEYFASLVHLMTKDPEEE